MSPATTCGAVNVGVSAAASLSVTVGPPVCVHAYLTTWFSRSELSLPSSVTVAPSATVWESPASAVGALFSPSRTVTLTVSVEVRPPRSVTVSENSSVASAVTAGASKVGPAALAELRVAFGPEVCVHA